MNISLDSKFINVLLMFTFEIHLAGHRKHTFVLPRHKMETRVMVRGLPLSTYAPRGRGGQVSYTFPLRITCKKGGGGRESR